MVSLPAREKDAVPRNKFSFSSGGKSYSEKYKRDVRDWLPNDGCCSNGESGESRENERIGTNMSDRMVTDDGDDESSDDWWSRLNNGQKEKWLNASLDHRMKKVKNYKKKLDALTRRMCREFYATRKERKTFYNNQIGGAFGQKRKSNDSVGHGSKKARGGKPSTDVLTVKLSNVRDAEMKNIKRKRVIGQELVNRSKTGASRVAIEKNQVREKTEKDVIGSEEHSFADIPSTSGGVSIKRRMDDEVKRAKMSRFTDSVSCGTCRKKFASEPALEHHQEVYTYSRGLPEVTRETFEHNSGDGGSMRAVCRVQTCCENFSKLEQYDRHQQVTGHGFSDARDTVRVYQIFEKTSAGQIICAYCRKLYKNSRNLRDHQATGCTGSQIFKCDFKPVCNKIFRKRSQLMAHYLEEHEDANSRLHLVNDLKLPQREMKNSEKAKGDVKEWMDEREEIGKSRTLYRMYTQVFTEHTTAQEVFTEENIGMIRQKLQQEISVNSAVSFQLCLPAIIYCQAGSERRERHHHFTTNAVTIIREDQINARLMDAVKNIYALQDRLEVEGSGWR